jgi:hypothetical protein
MADGFDVACTSCGCKRQLEEAISKRKLRPSSKASGCQVEREIGVGLALGRDFSKCLPLFLFEQYASCWCTVYLDKYGGWVGGWWWWWWGIKILVINHSHPPGSSMLLATAHLVSWSRSRLPAAAAEQPAPHEGRCPFSTAASRSLRSRLVLVLLLRLPHQRCPPPLRLPANF